MHQDPSAQSGLKNKQTAQGGEGADPDVESGFKELIKCCLKYTTLFRLDLRSVARSGTALTEPVSGIAERLLFQLRTSDPFSKLDAVGEFYLL